MDKDYRSLEHKIRDVVAEAAMNRNTDLRRKVVNVGRPDTALSNFDDKSKLAKQGEIKTKIIDEAKDDEDKDDKNKKADADADDKDDKKKSKSGEAKKAEDQMSGGKTEVDLEPKTNDKVVVDSDDKPKKTKKVTKEETMLKSDNKFGLPQDLIDAVTEALKGRQKKLDKNHNGKLDGHDFKILRGETKAKAKPEHDKARPAFTAKEEFELDEAVKTDNEGHGYHGEAHHAAKGEDKMAEAGKAYAKAHSLVKQHAADHLKDAKNPNKMVKHYLDSKHGRHLYGNENNAVYVKKDFGHFAKKYDAKMHEEVEQLDEIGNTPKGKATLKRYMKKADRDSDDHEDILFNKHNEIHQDAKDGDKWAQREYDHADHQYHKRLTGMERARKRLNKEEIEQLDEIGDTKKGKAVLNRYIKKADKNVEKHSNVMFNPKNKIYRKAEAGDPDAEEKYAYHSVKYDQRLKGMETAKKKLNKEDVELSDAEITRLEEIAKGL